ncbi:MAG: thiol:disulfide interchange protein DsbA/DsbL [Enterobacterales bacterium]|nr:thiol:disulfide interchange protein DsbA/DsbL [Enterobacterales bacterium]
MKNILKIGLFVCLSVLTTVSSNLSAAKRVLVEGSDYEVMTASGTKTPEIMEFFNYGCPHCYTMEDFTNNFKKKHSDIKFIAVPTDLGHPQWTIYVKAYYLGEILKVIDQSHGKIFQRIHVQNKAFTSDADLKAFFATLGVDGALFDKANKSFTLNAKIRKAKQLARKFAIQGTPMFVANQRFKLDNKKLGTTEMIEKAMVDLSQIIN